MAREEESLKFLNSLKQTELKLINPLFTDMQSIIGTKQYIPLNSGPTAAFTAAPTTAPPPPPCRIDATLPVAVNATATPAATLAATPAATLAATPAAIPANNDETTPSSSSLSKPNSIFKIVATTGAIEKKEKSKPMSFIDKMRSTAYESRKRKRNFSNDPEYIIEIREKDFNYFFKECIKNNARKKIERRANEGYTTATIYEYGIGDYFFFDNNGVINFTSKFIENSPYHLYKIHSSIISDHIISLINKYFVKELGLIYDIYTNTKMKTTFLEVCWADLKVENEYINHRWKRLLADQGNCS